MELSAALDIGELLRRGIRFGRLEMTNNCEKVAFENL